MAHETQTELSSLKNQFLISMPSLNNSIFSQTVTYVCEHNEHGAMGVIINRPSKLRLSDICKQLDMPGAGELKNEIVLTGGPVNPEQGIVLHREEGDWDSTLEISPGLFLTSSKDILHALLREQAPEGAQLALGYAGWSKGQLEQELMENCWLTMPADTAIVFDTPIDQRWGAVANKLGVDLSLISQTAGHS